jgi:uroporphyrinogen decarboxylase
MNARERFHRVANFEKVSPLKAEYGYWTTTVKNFIKQGMPVVQDLPDDLSDNAAISGAMKINPDSPVVVDENVRACFDLDPYIAKFPCDYSPLFEEKTVEENDEYRIYVDRYGITVKQLKNETAVPLDLDFPIKNRRDFESYKEHYDGDYAQRLPKNWMALSAALEMREYPIRLGGHPFGFFGLPRHLIGAEPLFLILYDDPQLIRDINEFFLHFVMGYWGAIFEDFIPDCVLIWEDMAGRQGSLISPAMFREFMQPYYVVMIDFFRQYGITNIYVDSDGYVEELLVLWDEIGVNGLFPFERQAGNDLLRIREAFPRLQMFGGIDKGILMKDRSRSVIDAELRMVQKMLQYGGYVPHIDHHVPDDAHWEQFSYYRRRLNELIDECGESHAGE